MADREVAKEKAARLLKKRGSVSTINSEIAAHRPPPGTQHHSHHPHHSKYPGSHSSVSYHDEPASEDLKNVQYENTYQLTATKRFPQTSVSNILKDVLESYLSEQKYDPEICRQMSKTLSEVIKARVKDLQLPRFKVVALITIGSMNDQGMTAGSRCLWDASVDTFSSYEFRNQHLFAIGTVYGIYTE